MNSVVVSVSDIHRNPVIRLVRLYSMATGALLADGLSNGISGLVVFDVGDFQGEAYVVVLDDPAGVLEELTIRRIVI